MEHLNELFRGSLRALLVDKTSLPEMYSVDNVSDLVKNFKKIKPTGMRIFKPGRGLRGFSYIHMFQSKLELVKPNGPLFYIATENDLIGLCAENCRMPQELISFQQKRNSIEGVVYDDSNAVKVILMLPTEKKITFEDNSRVFDLSMHYQP